MTAAHKVVAFSGATLLIGLGLCGIDTAFLNASSKELGGTLSLWGALICLASAVAFIAACIAALIDAVRGKGSS